MALEHVFSFQLFSSRNFPPLDEQCRTLASLGYTNVEPFGGLYGDLDGLKAAIDGAGLSAYSGHFGIDMLEQDFQGALKVARTLGTRLVVAPYLMPDLRPTDTEGWKAFGARLAAVGAKLKAEGLVFCWHNHDFEFVALPDGSFPIEHVLADENVKLELDIAWVVRAKQDPKLWIERYRDRIAAFHFKDIAPEGTREDEGGWADPGTGVVNWAELWPLALATGAKLGIAEHDNPSDYKRFAAKAVETIKSLG